MVGAGGDVGGRGLVAGAGGCEGGWEGCCCRESEEGGCGGEMHFWREVGGLLEKVICGIEWVDGGDDGGFFW